MNHSIYSADRATHLKVVVVALVAGILVAGFTISTRNTASAARPSASRKAIALTRAGSLTVTNSIVFQSKRSRPSGYSFLPELAGCSCSQVSIETAQSRLDCAVLAKLQGKKIMVGCLDLSDMTVETPQQVADRIRKALQFLKKEDVIVAPDCGMKYLPREVAFGKIKAMVEGAKILRTEVV